MYKGFLDLNPYRFACSGVVGYTLSSISPWSIKFCISPPLSNRILELFPSKVVFVPSASLICSGDNAINDLPFPSYLLLYTNPTKLPYFDFM